MSKCNLHHIEYEGLKCPVCSEKALKLPLFPFYFYINKTGLQTLGWTILVSVVFFFGVVPAISALHASTQRSNQEKAAKLDKMPPFWRGIHESSKKVAWDNDKKKLLNSMISAAKDVPPLPADSLSLFLEAFPNNADDIVQIIAPFVSK